MTTRARLPVATMIACCLVALLAANVGALVQHRADLRPAYAKDGVLTILAIGSDVGWPERPGDELRGRADALQLVAIDTAARRATIVSFPRDSLVGGTKVNAHLSSGGPEQLVAQMEAFTGLTIDHWALTTFHGLRTLAGAMGGIEVEVERPMTSPEANANLQPGVQTLNLEDALAFTRDRKSQPRGDFDRTRNQGRLMVAAHRQMRTHQHDLPTVSRLAAAFMRHTHTSIPRTEIIPLGLLALQIPEEHVRHDALAGGFGTAGGGASIVHLNLGDSIERIRAGQIGP